MAKSYSPTTLLSVRNINVDFVLGLPRLSSKLESPMVGWQVTGEDAIPGTGLLVFVICPVGLSWAPAGHLSKGPERLL